VDILASPTGFEPVLSA